MISRIWPDQDVVDVRRLEMMTADGLQWARYPLFATGEFHS
jgi:hypothetical protein